MGLGMLLKLVGLISLILIISLMFKGEDPTWVISSKKNVGLHS